MNYLQYTSKEMFSSTELIRKSKNIFEKLNKKEIEKAIILRDGKPSFMLLDFETYEAIMSEYIKLKELEQNAKEVFTDKINENPKINETKKESEVQSSKEAKNIDEIEDLDLQKALEEIDNINFDYSDDDTANNSFNSLEDIHIEEKPIQKKEEALKDFWEE